VNEKYHQQMFIFIVILTFESVCSALEAEPFVDLSAVSVTSTEPAAVLTLVSVPVCPLVDVTLTEDPEVLTTSVLPVFTAAD
jgi:hypothetical protein